MTDPSKAVIADAKVTAISAGTNVRYETTTNASGEYSMVNHVSNCSSQPDLPPGPYRLEPHSA